MPIAIYHNLNNQNYIKASKHLLEAPGRVLLFIIGLEWKRSKYFTQNDIIRFQSFVIEH